MNYYNERNASAKWSMRITESLSRKMDWCAKYYDLAWEPVPAGVLVSNGVEYWLVKFKKERVRRLFHQNHRRNGKVIALPCEKNELNVEVVQSYFHVQPWSEGDIKKVCCYISNHGRARVKIMEKQRALLAALA